MPKRIRQTHITDITLSDDPEARGRSVTSLTRLQADDICVAEGHKLGWDGQEMVRKPISHPSELPDYAFPTFVVPEFAHPMMQDILAVKVGERVPLHVIEHDVQFTPEDDATHPLPASYCTSMAWKGRRLAGPVFFSIAHPILKTDSIPFALRQQLVREMVEGAMTAQAGGKPFFDGIVIAVPNLNPNGATHRIFTDPEGFAATTFTLAETPGMTYYCFGEARHTVTEGDHPPRMSAIVRAHEENFAIVKASRASRTLNGEPEREGIQFDDRRAYGLIR